MDKRTAAVTDATDFKHRWQEFTRQAPCQNITYGYHREFPDAANDPFTVAHLRMTELRTFAMEFFSWGLVHQARTQRRLEELLPAGASDAFIGEGI
jgi:hypothetical protein